MSIKLVLALLAKSAVAASFAVIYLYSAELFPTQVRYVVYTCLLYSSRVYDITHDASFSGVLGWEWSVLDPGWGAF